MAATTRDRMAALEATIGADLSQVLRRIESACTRSGRSPDEVTLVAVTKTRTTDEIVAAHRQGARHFGENRVEELAEKLPELVEALAADPPTWHMIGHVQSRKARLVVETSDLVHSVDSLRLARRLGRFAGEAGTRLPVLLEINISGEAAKDGFVASKVFADPDAMERLVGELSPLSSLQYLDVRGLMTMAPIVAEPEEARPYFAGLFKLRQALRERAPFSGWDELSMGMTDDFEVAIEEGATLVRVGRAIFGPRAYA